MPPTAKAAIITLLMLVVSGCSPYRKPAPDTDYGAYPDNFKELVQDYLEGRPYFEV